MPVPRWCLVVLFTVAVAGCQTKVTAGTGLTERQRDSLIGQSKVPGAPVVHKALEVSDSAARRDARLDSAAAQP